jgi:rRNA maturation RNase YbeY
VYVDLDTAAERHEEFDTSFEEEARRYVAHGVLHLVGYDDRDADEQAVMRRLEDRFLAAVKEETSD